MFIWEELLGIPAKKRSKNESYDEHFTETKRERNHHTMQKHNRCHTLNQKPLKTMSVERTSAYQSADRNHKFGIK